MSEAPRAIVLATAPAGAIDLQVEDGPVPRPGANEVQVEMAVSLLDPREAARPDRPRPRIPGDEAVGVVAAVGSDVHDWYVGDRVALPASLPCLTCGACAAGRTTLCPTATRPGRDADGWLVGSTVAPAALLHHVPGQLSSAEAALVPGVVATAYHALKRGGVGPDVTVVVLGGDALGLQLTQLAALAGGHVVTVSDRHDRRETALGLGADLVLDPGEGPLGTRLRERLGDGADRVFLTDASATSLTDAVALLRSGGRVVVVDGAGGEVAQIAVPTLVAAELDVVGSYGATPQDVAELFDLAADDRLVLAPLVTAEIGVDDLGEIARRATEDALRVAVVW